MKADWMLPENQKLEVTLKILDNEKYKEVSVSQSDNIIILF